MSAELSNAEQFISWIKTKVHLNSIALSASKRFVKRGQVYWCNFGINIGAEMSKSTPRPAIVVSNFTIGRNGSNVVVVPVTHSSATNPSLVPITPIVDSNGDIILDGKANTSGIICVSKARLGDKITTLSASQMKNIDKGISVSLDLLHYYESEKDKYDKLSNHVDQVKKDRNCAQDALMQLRDIICNGGFTEDNQKLIKKILDIE